jgi:4,5-dihydroxyphthalate decarboxylase
MTIDLTLACYQYEWTRPLWDGRVEPEGVSLTTIDYPNPERFTRMVHHLEFDACELSMGTYLATRQSPESFPFTAIPVFPYRKFRHSYMYRRRGADIESPRDLEGARVGIVNWQTTTGIWQRGILANRHGVDLTEIDWYASGEEIVEVDPSAYDVEYLGPREGSSIHLLEDLLDRGELDAILHPVHAEAASSERLFDDPLATEMDYYRETGIFPIMHTIVVRDDLLEEEPWVAQKLYDAFVEAKRRGYETLERPRWMPLAWSRLLVERQREVLGDDPWTYGLGPQNTSTLETLVDYAVDQQVAAEPYAVDSLFATDHLDTAWFGSS